MKKTILFLSLFIAVLTLSACTDAILDDTPLTTEEQLSSEESLATLSYLSTGFLDFSTPVTVSNTIFLANGTSEATVIEGELDIVNVYFDRLKALIDNGVESFGSVSEEVSDNELYDYKLTFTVNEEVYIIYYSIDAETAEMTGIIVIGDVEYIFEVVDNMKEYSYQENEKNTDSTTNKETNQNSDDDSVVTDENEEKMVLIAHNGDDSIKIIYKTETEVDETTTKFYMEQTIAGVTSEISLKISTDADKYKIDIDDGEDRYTFKQIVEDNIVMYKLNYKVEGTVGMITIKEITNEDGTITYDYHIVEAGKDRHVEKQEPKSKGFDEDEEENPEVEPETEA